MRPDLTPPLDSQTVSGRRDKQLMQAAQDLEAGFIAEMLKSAGFGESRDSFGGGPVKMGLPRSWSMLRRTSSLKLADSDWQKAFMQLW